MANQSYTLTTGVYGIYDPTQTRAYEVVCEHDTVEWSQITSRSTESSDTPGTGTRAASNITGSVYALAGITDGRMYLSMRRGTSITAYRLERAAIGSPSERYASARMGSTPRISHFADYEASASMGNTPRFRVNHNFGITRMGGTPRISNEFAHDYVARMGGIPGITVEAESSSTASATMGGTPRIAAYVGTGGVGLDCVANGDDGGNPAGGVSGNYVF